MNLLDIAVVVTAILLIVMGIFCMAKTINMLRVVLGTEIAMKAISLSLIYIGYRTGNMATVQTFIIMVIILEAVTAVASAGIALALYKHYGSMDIKHVSKLKD